MSFTQSKFIVLSGSKLNISYTTRLQIPLLSQNSTLDVTTATEIQAIGKMITIAQEELKKSAVTSNTERD
ncbi:hypothetical protein BOTNAR_0034g00230 [Botryotinia narcissicola]|uniref:Uncharacterized protein n=1 Tax=Botryotinia narcissicola TaxID=278944 RepID=A0A4Z1JF83_9HELO|nr:hypothetical protein BOTNAR_0034g00230 [Botryotinia narcissicola]